MQKSVPRSFSTELNIPRCVPGTPESADPVLVGHDANQAPNQSPECRRVVTAGHPKIYFGILGRSSKQALRADKSTLGRWEAATTQIARTGFSGSATVSILAGTHF